MWPLWGPMQGNCKTFFFFLLLGAGPNPNHCLSSLFFLKKVYICKKKNLCPTTMRGIHHLEKSKKKTSVFSPPVRYRCSTAAWCVWWPNHGPLPLQSICSRGLYMQTETGAAGIWTRGRLHSLWRRVQNFQRVHRRTFLLREPHQQMDHTRCLPSPSCQGTTGSSGYI